MTNFISLLRKSLTGLGHYPAFLLAAWVVVLFSLPMVRLIFGDASLLQGLALAVLLQVAFVLHVLYRSWGWWSMLRTVTAVVLLSWIVQAIVIRSGLPYGNLSYSSLLQPHILGVPLLIPLAWMMMLPPAWAIAKLITQKLSGCLLHVVFVAVSAVAFTAWGFYFDPMLVHLGIIQWQPPGAFYGTPWLNYTGWLLVSGVITFGLSPKRLPGGLLVVVYGCTWLVDFIALFVFWGLFWPALIGFALMGVMLLCAALITR